MNLLAFDTSTEVMSVALQCAQEPGRPARGPWQHTAPGGAQTSTHLIPVIQQLMAQAGLQFGQLDAIVFGAGPGSFTGLRTACSVAQGLGFGAGVQLLPVDTLLAVAEEARAALAGTDAFRVTAVLDARMDEFYTADYLFEAARWRQLAPQRLIRPEALRVQPGWTLAGNVFASHGARLAGATLVASPPFSALPTAAALLRLAPALLASGAAVAPEQALPLYIRDKVAQTTAERAQHGVPR